MAVSAQIAIYPLRQQHLSPAVESFNETLRAHGLQVTPGPMSTYVVGDDASVFTALRGAFVRAAETGHVVMTIAISNACPIPD